MEKLDILMQPDLKSCLYKHVIVLCAIYLCILV